MGKVTLSSSTQQTQTSPVLPPQEKPSTTVASAGMSSSMSSSAPTSSLFGTVVSYLKETVNKIYEWLFFDGIDHALAGFEKALTKDELHTAIVTLCRELDRVYYGSPKSLTRVAQSVAENWGRLSPENKKQFLFHLNNYCKLDEMKKALEKFPNVPQTELSLDSWAHVHIGSPQQKSTQTC
jgi:hypothetical protein